MAKWEYAIGSFWTDFKGDKSEVSCNNVRYNKTSEMLNSMGAQGWELVSVSTFNTSMKESFSNWTYGYTYTEYFYFKRALP